MTNLHGKKGSTFERILWDDAVYTQHANSMLYYRSKSNYCRIYFMFKYHNRPEIAVNFGRMMAQELQGTDFFEGIDCMVPVPLSPQRMKQRGYNQSTMIAEELYMVSPETAKLLALKESILKEAPDAKLHLSSRTDAARSVLSRTSSNAGSPPCGRRSCLPRT